jgi:MYXO-CTERM domain-containing protein
VDPITGQIVGEAVNSLNRSIAFMWTPVPEPSTLAVAAVGLLALARRRRNI